MAPVIVIPIVALILIVVGLDRLIDMPDAAPGASRSTSIGRGLTGATQATATPDLGVAALIPLPAPVEGLSVRPRHAGLVVTWPAKAPQGSAEMISEVTVVALTTKIGQRPKRPCVTSGNRCVFGGLIDGMEYTLTVVRQNPSGRSVPQTVTAIPRPDVLVSAASRLWLDAADAATVVLPRNTRAALGAPVMVWRDKSPQGADASRVAPDSTPKLSTVAGHTALAFDGLSRLTLVASGLPAGSVPSAIYVVAEQDDPRPSTSCFRHVIAWGATVVNGGRAIHKGCYTPLAYADTFGTWQLSHPKQGWPQGRPAVLTADYFARGVDVRMNGSPSYKWRTHPGVTLNTVRAEPGVVGAAPWDPTAAWQGKIAEIVVLATIPTPAQDRAIVRYLRVKWGV